MGATTAGGWVVACGSCALSWNRAGAVTDLEQQALESRPCPGCGAYTLTCGSRRNKPDGRRTPDAARPRRAA